MKTLHFLLIFCLMAFARCLFLPAPASAQITFQKTFGGTDSEVRPSIEETRDGGYIIGGYTWSYGSGNSDYYLIKTDANGDTLWTRTFGGPLRDEGYCLQQTADSGYVIAGSGENSGAGEFDVYLIKTDADGNLLWEKTYGGSSTDRCYSIQQTADGGYVLAGATYSFGTGDLNVYLIKTDSTGNMLWSKTYGGSNTDLALSVHQTSDGGYIISGSTDSFGTGYEDIYIIKTDTAGAVQWSKTFGGIYVDEAISIQPTSDGGYIITAYTKSFSTPPDDVYLIKIDSIGNSIWSRTYGGIDRENCWSVMQTSEGGYILAGFTNSFGTGNYDVYLIRTDINGDTLWTKIFGGVDNDFGYSVKQTTDGGYIITGLTESYGAGNYDIYLIKTDSLGNSGCNQGSTTTIVTTPATQVTNPATIVNSPPTIVTTSNTTVGNGGIVHTLCTTVGINPIFNLQSSIFNISPNPSPGNFTITFTNAINRGEVQIFNAYGSKIFTQNIHHTSNTEIHLKHIPGGIYFVKVFDGEKYFSNKIIIQQE